MSRSSPGEYSAMESVAKAKAEQEKFDAAVAAAVQKALAEREAADAKDTEKAKKPGRAAKSE